MTVSTRQRNGRCQYAGGNFSGARLRNVRIVAFGIWARLEKPCMSRTADSFEFICKAFTDGLIRSFISLNAFGVRRTKFQRQHISTLDVSGVTSIYASRQR